MYHSIDDSQSVISIDRDRFRQQMEWLARGPVTVTTPGELLAPSAVAPPGGPAVALTFDDAFRNFATEAWPILRDLGLPVSLFVPTGHVGGTNAWNAGSGVPIPTLDLMDWSSVARLATEGVTIGSHTCSHPDLRTIPPARLEDELVQSAETIERAIGLRPADLAYPYGAVDTTVATAGRRHYRAAFTTVLSDLPATTDRWRIPRLDMFYFRRPGQIERFGSVTFRNRVRVRRLGRHLRNLLS